MPQVAANPDSPTGSLDALTIDGIDYSFDLRGHATSMGDQLSIASGGGADSIQAPSMGANLFSLGDVGASIRKVQQRIHIDVGATDHVYECLIVRATLGATTWTWEEILYRTPAAERVTVAAGPAAWAEFTIGDDVNLTTTGTSSGVATIVRRVDGGEGFLVAQHTGAAQWHNEFSRQADGTDIVSGWPFDMTWVGRAAFTGTPVPADGASVTDATDRPWRQIIDYEMLLPGEISHLPPWDTRRSERIYPGRAPPELDSIQIGAQVYTLPTLTPALPNAVGPLWGTVTFVAAARVTAETDVAADGFTFTPTADTPTGVAKVGNTITLPRDITDDDVLGLWVIAPQLCHRRRRRYVMVHVAEYAPWIQLGPARTVHVEHAQSQGADRTIQRRRGHLRGLVGPVPAGARAGRRRRSYRDPPRSRGECRTIYSSRSEPV